MLSKNQIKKTDNKPKDDNKKKVVYHLYKTILMDISMGTDYKYNFYVKP